MSTVLLSDLSNSVYVKLALVSLGERPTEAKSYLCHSIEDFDVSVVDFLKAHDQPELMAAAVSACGWENNGSFSMPNHGFRMDRQHLRDLFKIQRLHVVNDCVSRAMAIDRLLNSELTKVCGGNGEDGQVRALVGAGRGLGLAGIVPDDLGRPTILPCEGGHADLAVTTAREAMIFERMEARYGHVSRERVVCLQGLVDIYDILQQIDGIPPSRLSVADIIQRAGKDEAIAQDAVNLSLGFLAAMAGDTALMLGARGGIYLAGEYINLIRPFIDWSAFHARFTDKGRLRQYMEDIPVYVIDTPDLELIGLTTLFE